ncbi:hypothetical protein COO03_11775 [Bacillus sp. AFS098217]|uniref:magnesium transporter n=1 Tax=unclassified Bacillus (in: firmicutes) TaxID=185979 RepID=UPI000BEB6A73|nr:MULTISPECIES: magnesium transporter [unclassified Bacillus (in: firmicutes)]PEB52459.1 hypothetical protein COO03_11775 [Bacillus sp. AFS098217]PEU20354.1 hypothetical protein CN525_04540 [Bacillus sp. AFS014408]PFW65295.1 hypothetical protein COL20_01270 [Bacillus sp. AFS075034]
MTWLSFFLGYFAGILVTFLLIYFAYRIGWDRKSEDKWAEDCLRNLESVQKEMEQLKAIRENELNCR